MKEKVASGTQSRFLFRLSSNFCVISCDFSNFTFSLQRIKYKIRKLWHGGRFMPSRAAQYGKSITMQYCKCNWGQSFLPFIIFLENASRQPAPLLLTDHLLDEAGRQRMFYTFTDLPQARAQHGLLVGSRRRRGGKCVIIRYGVTNGEGCDSNARVLFN